MTNLEEAFNKVDWALLAQQKLTLLKTMDIVACNGTDAANNLSGILHFLDAVQDAAEKDGFRVVFLSNQP